MKKLAGFFIFCILIINFFLFGERFYKRKANFNNIDTEINENKSLFFWKINDTIRQNNWESQFIKIENKYAIPHLLNEDINSEDSDNQANRGVMVMLEQKKIPRKGNDF